MNPVVSIVRIENENIEKAVRKAIELAGGIEAPSKNSKPILIKPNALKTKDTWEDQITVTTHPEVVRAVIRVVKEMGHKIVVGDSSGGGTKTQRVLEKAGFKKLEKEEGVPVINLSVGAEKIEITDAVKVKSSIFSKVALDYNIINVPKMKTHTLTTVTLAVKNLFGCIPGMEKKRIHSIASTAKGFSQCLLDLYSVLKDNIIMNVLDGQIAMEGHGPSSGPAKRMDLIIASKDAIALDAVATKIMGVNPYSVFTNKLGEKRKLGIANLKEIDVVGKQIEEVKSKFAMPERFIRWVPIGRFWKLGTKQPVYKGSGCKACLRCERVCPVNAIKVDRETKQPIFDYKKCISCFCCFELCEEEVIYIGRLKYKKKIIIYSSIFALVILTAILLPTLL